MEIKRQLDATEVFIADLIACSTCFGHHYTHHPELKSIIQWLLPVVFRAVVFKLLVWCGAEGYVSGLQDAAASNFVIPNKCLKNFICAASKRCSSLFFSTQASLSNFNAALAVILWILWKLGPFPKGAHPYRKACRSRGIKVAAPPLDSHYDRPVTYAGDSKHYS